MPRVAFLLRLKKDAGPAYDESHIAVWPEMLDLLNCSNPQFERISARSQTQIPSKSAMARRISTNS